jgi:hypothetical protein
MGVRAMARSYIASNHYGIYLGAVQGPLQWHVDNVEAAITGWSKIIRVMLMAQHPSPWPANEPSTPGIFKRWARRP